MNLEDARQQFPALEHKVFLDAACVSLAPRVAIEAIQQYLEMASGCPAPSSTQLHVSMDEIRATARPEAARLIGAHEDEIALVESTTHGLTLAANAIPLERGDRVLICDLEYLQVAIPWSQKQREAGIHIDPVPNRGGRIETGDIESRMVPRTRVVCISSVQWINGYRCDLDALAALCRERGVWLVVDAIQQMGAVPLDVRKTPVDIVACGGHKWLNAPFGNGFLFIRREALPRLRAPIAGYMSLDPPEGGWENYFQTPSISPFRDYRFANKAWRYEVGGTAGYPAAMGLAASLRLINSLGSKLIWNHILELTGHLIDGLRSLGITVVTPAEPEHRSGIVTFSVGGAEENIALMRRLLAQKILVSVRYTSHVGGVRVSCHFFNSLSDVDALLNAVEECR